jgi:hypothetical protein
LRAVVVIQPPGLGGTPSTVHRFGRDRERIGDRVLGLIERGRAPTHFSSVDGGELMRVEAHADGAPRKPRTSTGHMQASDPLRAHSKASSRSVASITVKPPICSFASAYGPSVIDISPSAPRTTVADAASVRAPKKTHAPGCLHLLLHGRDARHDHLGAFGFRQSPQ